MDTGMTGDRLPQDFWLGTAIRYRLAFLFGGRLTLKSIAEYVLDLQYAIADRIRKYGVEGWKFTAHVTIQI